MHYGIFMSCISRGKQECDNKAIITSGLWEEVIAKDVWTGYSLTSAADHKNTLIANAALLPCEIPFVCTMFLFCWLKNKTFWSTLYCRHSWVTIFPAPQVVKSKHSLQRSRRRDILLSNAAQDTKTRMCRTRYSRRDELQDTGCTLFTHDVDFPELVDSCNAGRWEYLQSHEAGTLCRVIRLLEKDLTSLNNLDLSLSWCHWKEKRQESLGWVVQEGMAWGDVVTHRRNGRRGGGYLNELRSWVRVTEREHPASCAVLYSAKRLSQSAQWENHVLENVLVYDPSSELQLRTQMNLSKGP